MQKRDHGKAEGEEGPPYLGRDASGAIKPSNILISDVWSLDVEL
jgi:hypothetical protein